MFGGVESSYNRSKRIVLGFSGFLPTFAGTAYMVPNAQHPEPSVSRSCRYQMVRRCTCGKGTTIWLNEAVTPEAESLKKLFVPLNAEDVYCMHDDGCALDVSGRIGLMSNRREVLRLALGSAGALVLSAVFRPVSAAPVTGSKVSLGDRVPITVWVRVASDGSVTLIASQCEMGQGITTTLAAALADELYLSWENVKIEFGPFDPAYRDPVYQWMFTGNSESTSSFYEIMRKMAPPPVRC